MEQISGRYLPAVPGLSTYSYKVTWKAATPNSVSWLAIVSDGSMELFLGGLIKRAMAECALEDVVSALEVEIEKISALRTFRLSGSRILPGEPA